MVYHCAGCRDHTLLPYTIWSLQGYPRELVQCLGMDITLDDVLTILDKHYNNIKALDALKQELFQLWMADKETVLDRGVCLLSHLQVWLLHFQITSLLTVWQSWNATDSVVVYPNILKLWWHTLKPAHRKGHILITCGLQGRQRRKTQWSSPKAHVTKLPITPPNLGWLVSSFYRSLRGPSWHLKHPNAHLENLEEESARGDKEVESKDPNGINGVTEEFMVHLVRAVNDAQVEEKHLSL